MQRGQRSAAEAHPRGQRKEREVDRDGINWSSTNAYFDEATIAAVVADSGKPNVEMLRSHGTEAVCRQSEDAWQMC